MNTNNRVYSLPFKKLAEAIMLQSIEDLWNHEERPDCIGFFAGEGYRICSEIADMDSDDKVVMLQMVRNVLNKQVSTGKKIMESKKVRQSMAVSKMY